MISTCPTAKELQRFLLGDIPDQDAERVEQHLAQCPTCLGQLASLHGEDTLSDAVQANPTMPGLPQGEEVKRLIEQWCKAPSVPTLPPADITHAGATGREPDAV